MREWKEKIFIVIVSLILLIPFVGMAFWPTNETTEYGDGSMAQGDRRRKMEPGLSCAGRRIF